MIPSLANEYFIRTCPLLLKYNTFMWRVLMYRYTPWVDFTKGFKTWHKFSTEIRFMLIPIIVLFIAHEFITEKF